MDPFTSIWVQPHIGPAGAVLMWNLPPHLLDGTVYPYQSRNGMPGTWEPLGAGVPANGSAQVQIQRGSVLEDHHYRLILQHGDQEYRSRPVNTYGRLSRHEFDTMGAMFHTLLASWKMQNGIRMWHYCPSVSRELATGTNPTTTNPLDSCPAQDSYPDAPRGYDPPVYVIIQVAGALQENAAPNQTGQTDAQKITLLRMLPHPKPGRGHVLVNPHTDERWVLHATQKVHAFRGFAPIQYAMQAEVLDRQDRRYRLIPPPIPDVPTY